jgi:hypothetical protein
MLLELFQIKWNNLIHLIRIVILDEALWPSKYFGKENWECLQKNITLISPAWFLASVPDLSAINFSWYDFITLWLNFKFGLE